MNKKPSAFRLKLSGFKRRYLQQKVVEDQRKKLNYAFIHIPKCGGTSLTRALNQRIKVHDTALERQKKLGGTRWREIYTFSVVRHPYDRTVSYYNFILKTHFAEQRVQGLDLNDWVKAALQDQSVANNVITKELTPCKAWVSNEIGEVIVDDIFHLEDIDTYWATIKEKSGVTGSLPRVNSSNGRLSRDDLNGESISILQEYFSADFKEFGYGS